MSRRTRTGRQVVVAALGCAVLTAGTATAQADPKADAAALGKRTLKLGTSGGDVRALQGYLDAIGYANDQNGRYDRPTRFRVRQFEHDSGIKADGVVDSKEAKTIIALATAPLTPGSVGGTSPVQPGPTSTTTPLTKGEHAKLLSDGLAAAPESAPPEVKAIIASGNQIAKLPYKWGGGHGSWKDTGYDCSGSLTFALRTTFRKGQMPTFGYSSWKLPGKGKWITTYASSYHVYMVVAGLRFDTSGLHENGSRWTNSPRWEGNDFVARHPSGF